MMIERMPAAASRDRAAVARALREIGRRLAQSGGDARYRARAYERAARSLERLPEDLGRVIAEGRLLQISGVGPALAAVITELYETGRSERLETLREEQPGEPPAAPARRRGDVLFAHADEEAQAVIDYAQSYRGTQAARTGGVRRALETVDAVEVVAAARDRAGLVRHLSGYAALESAATTKEDVSGTLADGTPVRVWVVTPSEAPLAQIRRSGSAAHVARLEALAVERGRRLTTRGLGSPKTEADVYGALGLPFIPPELREDAGEIEAAQQGRLPVRLLEETDVIGAVHCHTVASDGRHTLLQMARAAESRGFRYMTVTDHSPLAHYARGLTLDRLKAQWDEIAQVQEQVGIRLLRGSECDITREGELDWPDDVIAQLDVLIVSIHQRFKLDAAAMTARVRRALEHPAFKIWGHPFGRLVGRRPPIAVDFDAILDTLAGSRAAVEINGDPHRLDMEPALVRRAHARGLRFVVSTDAHSTGELRYVRYGTLMARRGWLTSDDVLNTLSADEFAQAVRPLS
jgi:DNA polymerase (family 10)